MQKNILSIDIQKPCSEVFAFTLNPKNTPRWIGGIAEEMTNEWPPRIGTIYQNRGTSGPWTKYVITALEADAMMEMKMLDGNYHVRYTYTPIDDHSSRLEYTEWVDDGELAEPFTEATMKKVKDVLEASATGSSES